MYGRLHCVECKCTSIDVHAYKCILTRVPPRSSQLGKRECAYIRRRHITHRKSHVCAGAAESETTEQGKGRKGENPSGVRIPIAGRGSKSPFFRSCNHAFLAYRHNILSLSLSDRFVHPVTRVSTNIVDSNLIGTSTSCA